MSAPWSPRSDRPDGGPVSHLRLADELERLRAEPAWRDGDRNAITLTKGPGLRLVLTILRRGAALHEHRAPGAVSIHVLSGRMTVTVGDQARTLAAGDIVLIDAGLVHAVEALEDTAFLLTLASGAATG